MTLQVIFGLGCSFDPAAGYQCVYDDVRDSLGLQQSGSIAHFAVASLTHVDCKWLAARSAAACLMLQPSSA